jgi:O-antigen ligase
MNAAVITMLEAENNQGSVRFAIWVNSLSVIFEAPYVGWGPGAHAGIEFPHDNFESHNTLLDWGSGTGLMGVLSLLVVYFWVVVVTIKFRSGTLLATVVALITVSMFHNYLRQPVFWFYLLLPLLLANFLSFYADLRSKASCVE